MSVKLEDETPGTRRLYAEYQQEIWEHTDRMFLWLLVAQWLGLDGIVVEPRGDLATELARVLG